MWWDPSAGRGDVSCQPKGIKKKQPKEKKNMPKKNKNPTKLPKTISSQGAWGSQRSHTVGEQGSKSPKNTYTWWKMRRQRGAVVLAGMDPAALLGLSLSSHGGTWGAGLPGSSRAGGDDNVTGRDRQPWSDQGGLRKTPWPQDNVGLAGWVYRLPEGPSLGTPHLLDEWSWGLGGGGAPMGSPGALLQPRWPRPLVGWARGSWRGKTCSLEGFHPSPSPGDGRVRRGTQLLG